MCFGKYSNGIVEVENNFLKKQGNFDFYYQFPSYKISKMFEKYKQKSALIFHCAKALKIHS